MAYDYSKLNGRIIEKCGTKGKFAKAIGLSERSVSLKLNNKGQFTQRDIESICSVLGLKARDIVEYFFCPMCSNS